MEGNFDDNDEGGDDSDDYGDENECVDLYNAHTYIDKTQRKNNSMILQTELISLTIFFDHISYIYLCIMFHYRPWDVAQIVPRDRIASSETFEGVLKGMKALLYFLLLIGVWVCAISSQGSLLLLTSALIKVSVQVLLSLIINNKSLPVEVLM